VLERAGRAEEALAQHQRAVSLNAYDVTARGRLVATAMNLRRFDVAEPHLRILAEQNYQPARTHYALGVIAESRGDKATATNEYRRALAIDPKFASAQEALRRVSR
jgi:Flp pilus assembly protein TadD